MPVSPMDGDQDALMEVGGVMTVSSPKDAQPTSKSGAHLEILRFDNEMLLRSFFKLSVFGDLFM